MTNPDHDVKARRNLTDRAGRSDAFTLVELLVAVAILSIIILLILGVLNQVSSTWTQISSQIDRHQNGRSILAMIASDLRPAALPIDRTNLYNLEMLVDPASLIGAASPSYSGGGGYNTGGGYLNAHAIFWQAPIATTSTGGGKMAEVGYFIRWVNPTSTNPRAILCRFFVNPGDPNYLIYSTPTAWLTPAVLDSAAPGYNAASTTATQVYPSTGWFADNVIGMWVRCLDANGAPITRAAATSKRNSPTLNYSFDSRLGIGTFDPSYGGTTPVTETPLSKGSYTDVTSSAGSLVGGGSPSAFAQQYACTLPSAIEIAIVVIDARTASRVTAVPSYAALYTNATAPVGYGAVPAAYTSTEYSPVNFWNDINYFMSNLKTSQPIVARGAHVYAMRISLANGG